MTTEAHAKQLAHSAIVSILTHNKKLAEENSDLKQQLAWLKKQLFGKKSEKRLEIATGATQLSLGEVIHDESEESAVKTVVVAEHERKANKKDFTDAVEDKGLRFDADVPVTTIVVPNKEVEGLEEGKDYEVISKKVTYRLAQKPAVYEVIKYERDVVKLKESEKIVTAPAPEAVIETSIADVSFLAGLLIDKFSYHLPLYRQHQRLSLNGITISRQTLTNLVHRTADFLKPIYQAQLRSIVESAVLAMDETPIKAGTKGDGKMKQGYFWPVYGDKDEVAFPYFASRAEAPIRAVLGEYCGTLVTDGYAAYERYAQSNKSVVHAVCWAHLRRKFIEAESLEPELCRIALEHIGALYEVEAQVKQTNRTGNDKLDLRIKRSYPVAQKFFAWLSSAMGNLSLLDSNPFTKAASYALKREHELKVFLTDPYVPIDTNHIERAIRPIPMGRKNWLFCMTEVGAEVVGIVQSLLFTCKLHGINPYTYLVDVLQRIDNHPMSQVEMLTPRLWKDNFAGNPMRAPLDLL